ncbi:hypothetical protein C0581_03875, partial [Candidatus Parcubacteria bacterium]
MIQKLQKQQRTLLWVCLIFVSFVYFISSAYITNSNDGSHFALTSAIVEKGTVEIAGYEEYVEGMDYALQGNRILSDRIPGTAFLAIPFFSIGHVFSFVHDNLSEIMVLFLPQLAGVLLVYLIFRLSFYFSKNFNVSLLSALLFAFTTLVWFESTHLFSHILSAVTAFGAAYLCVKLKKGDTGKIILVAALLGLSSIIEIQNILLVPAFLLYLFSRKKIDIKFWKDKGVMMGTLVFVAVYAILIGYNYVAFSEFTIKSNKYNPNFIEEQAFSSSLSGNPIKGLDHLFTNFSEMHFVTTWADGVRHNSPGYFILSPLLLISLVGFYFFSKQYSRETELFVYIILVISLIGAFHKTVITRHVFTMLPFLWFPIIFVLDKISHLDKRTRSVLLTGISIVAVY